MKKAGKKMKKGFTLIELIVAVALLAIVLTFAGLIFKVGVGAYRLANANAEIMRNLRAITDQLNSDFAGFQKDGYLIIDSSMVNQSQFKGNLPENFHSDKIYYFSTGDYQSWFESGGNYPQSNMARIWWGHDSTSDFVNRWQLARKVVLLGNGSAMDDRSNKTFSEYKMKSEDPTDPTSGDPNYLHKYNLAINTNSIDGINQLICQNLGEFKIEWTDGTKIDTGNNTVKLEWYGYDLAKQSKNPDPRYSAIETMSTAGSPTLPGNPYKIIFKPETSKELLPKAIKFTFRLYDSKGIIKTGRTFSHIVYIDKF